MAQDRYYQDPNNTTKSSEEKQYNNQEKSNLETAQTVTKSLNNDQTRQVFENKLKQGLEDLNLIQNKVISKISRSKSQSNGNLQGSNMTLSLGQNNGSRNAHSSSNSNENERFDVTASTPRSLGDERGPATLKPSTPNTMFNVNGSHSNLNVATHPIQSIAAGPSNNNHNLIIPINDLRVSDAESEKLHEQRCNLASLYRLIGLNNWDHQIYNQISYRISENEYLISPFGLLYYEVTASKLLTVSCGSKSSSSSSPIKIINQGSTNLGFNQNGFSIHKAVHEARPEVAVVINCHLTEVIACGLNANFLQNVFSQEGCILGPVSWYRYGGVSSTPSASSTPTKERKSSSNPKSDKNKDNSSLDKEEQKLIKKALGKKSKILMIANQGACILGNSIEEAYHYLYHLVHTCKTQLAIMNVKILANPELAVSQKVKKKTFEIVNGGDPGPGDVGRVLYEANMRKLDNSGYRTGYRYSDGYQNYRLELENHIHNTQRLALEAQLANNVTYERRVLTPEESRRERENEYQRKLAESKRSNSQIWACTPNKYAKKGLALLVLGEFWGERMTWTKKF